MRARAGTITGTPRRHESERDPTHPGHDNADDDRRRLAIYRPDLFLRAAKAFSLKRLSSFLH
ncbi:hypothetical protein [Rhizobium sullae]|uniref:hypothetical protein n=1 Tax=Rhizobium sullae TaxID=50338 RepID=UPI0012FD0984|nr:hypothetical protein [Rhizobium sullae]